MGVIIFNGISSKTFGIEVVHPPHYRYAERRHIISEVPGSNGDYYINSGGFKNVEAEYELNFIVDDNSTFEEHSATVSEWLHSGKKDGYSKLEDSYNPNWYRLAVYNESGVIENVLNGGGRITVRFNCKPQKWLKSGDETIELQNGDTIINPTINDAEPLFYVSNSQDGSLTIGENTIQIKKSDSSYTAVSGNVVRYGNSSFIYGISKWNSYSEPENPSEYTAENGDIVSYNGNDYVYDGTKWIAYTSYPNHKYVGVSITQLVEPSEHDAVDGDVAIYGDDQFIFDGESWHAYTIKEITFVHDVSEGDVVTYGDVKYVFDGEKWITFTEYDNARYIGISDTEIEEDSMVDSVIIVNRDVGPTSTPISDGSMIATIISAIVNPVVALNNSFVGETTTSISDGAQVNPIVVANYTAEMGDFVIYNDYGFVFDGTKWVAEDNYNLDKKFVGQTSTQISENSTVNPIGLDGMFIDCEKGNAYLDDGNLNLNRLITCPEFPILSPGSNVIVFENLSSVRVTPRWYMI